MAKQHLSKKGRERFNKKKPPKGERKRKQPHERPPNNGTGGVAARPLHKKKNAGAERRQRSSAKKKRAEGLPLGFSAAQRTLLVGEGNLSFARALVRLFGGYGANLVATTFDEEEALREARDLRAQWHTGALR